MQGKRNEVQNNRTARPATAEDKIARALGLLLVRELEVKDDQAALLRSIGFEVSEVAAMLGMTENHVAVAASRGRKKAAKRSVRNRQNA